MLRRVLRLGLLAGIGVGVLRVVRGRKAPDPWADSWVSTGPPGGTRPSPAPVAAAPKPAPAATTTAAAPPPAEADKSDAGKSAPSRAAKQTRKGPARKSPTGKAEDPPGERLWVPANDGVCPPTHPVKAKLSSKIFHTPTGRNYKSTKADRCYPDESSAQADGLRPAQR
ncbi:MAG TPA: hypothetical protein VG034_08330 [Acidimicrobiia bacterium]|jgi:hypothetical protein|nr:hypothetical protein [Acidimicrobiia bacterium]